MPTGQPSTATKEVGRRSAALEAFATALLGDDPVTLYERAPCGYLSTTPDGVIVKANQTLLTWTGYGQEDLVGQRRLVDLLTPGGRIYHETHYAPMLRMQGAVREIALDVVRADGHRLPVLLNAVLERDSRGAPTVVRVAVFDATERREYERELLRAKTRAEEAESRATALARTLQETLIPPTPPAIVGLDVAAAYRPAGNGDEVGGDFYDVFQIGEGDWMVTLGDVCGKGVDAAVVTALVRHTLRAGSVRLREPQLALHALNEVLLSHHADRFCTVLLLRMRRGAKGWTVTLASGGHPLPLLVRLGQPPAEAGTPGPLVGVLESPTFEEADLRLAGGDLLVCYTDGVTEGRRDGEFYGEQRLRARVAECAGSAAEVSQGLLADLVDFQRGRPRDDIAVVAVGVPVRGGGD